MYLFVLLRDVDKQVIIKNLKINASPNIKICSDMSYFYASLMKLCLSKQAGSLFLESLFINLFISLLFLKGVQSKCPGLHEGNCNFWNLEEQDANFDSEFLSSFSNMFDLIVDLTNFIL